MRDDRSSHSAPGAALTGTCILRLYYARSINHPPYLGYPLFDRCSKVASGDSAHAPLRKANHNSTCFGLIRDFFNVRHRVDIWPSTSGAPTTNSSQRLSPPLLHTWS